MNEKDRWMQILELDDEFLKGGVILSEWCSFIVRESDRAYTAKAFLGAILTSMSGIESYLRSDLIELKRAKLVDLINGSNLEVNLKNELHQIRKYRNKWVHVDEPWNDSDLLNEPQKIEDELEDFAYRAVVALRKTIYSSPWV